MKTFLIILALLPLIASADDSFFFVFAQNAKQAEQRIEGENLHLVIPIQKITTPKASSIFAFHQGLGEGRDYQIQVNLTDEPEEGWMPMLKLGDEIIVEGISVARLGDVQFASSFSLESSDPEQIKTWCKELGILLKIPNSRIQIELKEEEEQAGDSDAE